MKRMETRFEISEERLREMVDQNLSTVQIGKALGCSSTNVRHWLKRFGLQTHPLLSQEAKCGLCGETDSAKFYGHKKNVCGRCHCVYTLKRGQFIREKAIGFLGGKCVSCGFDRFPVSLDIHHLDPSLKDPNFVSVRSWKWERVERELQGCVLLCKNCHAAVHAGLLELAQTDGKNGM